MVDIVYVVGKGAKSSNDLPLRWSLRSVEKFAENAGKIVVAGYPPDWLSDEVIKVPFEQTHRKHINMLLSIDAAVKQAKLVQPFLFSADDHYFCKKADLSKWPRYCMGTLPSLKGLRKEHHNDKYMPNNYYLNLCQTRFLLLEAGMTKRRFCLHVDTWTDPHDLDAAVEFVMKHEKKCKLGVEPTCILGALYEKRMNDIGIEVKYTEYKNADDKKVGSPEECQAKIDAGLPMFSSKGDLESTSREFAAWMDNFFCQKSKYEK